MIVANNFTPYYRFNRGDIWYWGRERNEEWKDLSNSIFKSLMSYHYSSISPINSSVIGFTNDYLYTFASKFDISLINLDLLNKRIESSVLNKDQDLFRIKLGGVIHWNKQQNMVNRKVTAKSFFSAITAFLLQK